MVFAVRIGEEAREIEVVARRPRLRLRVGARTFDVVEESGEANGPFEISFDGRMVRGHRFVSAEGVWLHLLGRTVLVTRVDAGAGAQAGARHDEVRAEMPGMVVAVHVAAGARVTTGDDLLTLESMKLQVTVVAERDGHVDRVLVEPNTAFERGALLLAFRTPEPGAVAVGGAR